MAEELKLSHAHQPRGIGAACGTSYFGVCDIARAWNAENSFLAPYNFRKQVESCSYRQFKGEMRRIGQ